MTLYTYPMVPLTSSHFKLQVCNFWNNNLYFEHRFSTCPCPTQWPFLDFLVIYCGGITAIKLWCKNIFDITRRNSMGLLPDAYNCGLRLRRECLPRHRLQKKLLVSDPGMHHGTCVTRVQRCISGWLTRGGVKTFPAFAAHTQPAILLIWQEAHSHIVGNVIRMHVFVTPTEGNGILNRLTLWLFTLGTPFNMKIINRNNKALKWRVFGCCFILHQLWEVLWNVFNLKMGSMFIFSLNLCRTLKLVSICQYTMSFCCWFWFIYK